MSFYRHRTMEGDRWDRIASKFRNNPYDYVDIIAANPTYQGVTNLPGGVLINVPVKVQIEAKQKVIPPWRR